MAYNSDKQYADTNTSPGSVPPYEDDHRGSVSEPKVGELVPGEAEAGGLGRHLGLFSTTFLMWEEPIDRLYIVYSWPSKPSSIGRIIGTGIFSTPSSIVEGVGSVGAAFMLWLLGLALSFAGLCIWLELGCMIPRSGGEKVYLEAMYTRPKLLATTVFAVYAVVLGFTAQGTSPQHPQVAHVPGWPSFYS
jgi:hypothetical protein